MSAEVWAAIGSIGAAAVTGVFGVLSVMVKRGSDKTDGDIQAQAVRGSDALQAALDGSFQVIGSLNDEIDALNAASEALQEEQRVMGEELAALQVKYPHALMGLREYREKAPAVKVWLHPDVAADL